MVRKGEPVAMTLGQLIQLMVDNGDVAVVATIVKDGPQDDKGKFARRIDVVLIPNGHVSEILHQYSDIPRHKVLTGLMDAGIIT